MQLRHKILPLLIGILIGSQGIILTAQTKKNNLLKDVQLGFQAGSEIKLKETLVDRNSQSGYNTGVNLRKKLTPHFKLEIGFTYASFQSKNTLTTSHPFQGSMQTCSKLYSLPVTVQYYVLSKKHKFNPYLGAGIQCSYNTVKYNQIQKLPGDRGQFNNCYSQDKKYISIQFTQGTTYEVSTKIQLYQSFHFIPANDKAIGFDLGIGFNIR